MPPTGAGRPRVGVISPYWTLWEHTAGPTFRADRMALARSVADELATTGTVDPVTVVEIASGDDGVRVGREFVGADIDVVLVLQTMAVPAAWTMAAITALPGVPVVIWALHETGLVEGAFDHGSITTQGATVGAPMLSNLLTRADRPFAAKPIMGAPSFTATHDGATYQFASAAEQEVKLLANLLPFLKPGALLAAVRGEADWPHNVYRIYWNLARSDSFSITRGRNK